MHIHTSNGQPATALATENGIVEASIRPDANISSKRSGRVQQNHTATHTNPMHRCHDSVLGSPHTRLYAAMAISSMKIPPACAEKKKTVPRGSLCSSPSMTRSGSA